MHMVEHPVIRENLNLHGTHHLHNIQREAILEVRSGRDVLLSTTSATGKIGMYMIPLLDQLATETERFAQAMTHQYDKKFLTYIKEKECLDNDGQLFSASISPKIIVIFPDNEVATSVFRTVSFLANGTEIRPMLVCGRMSHEQCMNMVGQPCDILVCTVGRLHRLSKAGKLNLGRLTNLVLDEFHSFLVSEEQTKSLHEIFFQESGFTLDAQGSKVQRIFSDAGYVVGAGIGEAQKWLRKDESGNVIAKPPIIFHHQLRDTRSFRFVHVNHGTDLLEGAVSYVEQELSGKLLIIVPTREIANRLGAELTSRLPGRPVQVSHSKISHHQRKATSQLLSEDDNVIVVACLLFSRGVNVANLTNVLFVGCPIDPAVFNQASSLVGRKGAPGTVHTLFQMGNQADHWRYKLCQSEARSRNAVIRLFEFAPLSLCEQSVHEALGVAAREKSTTMRAPSRPKKPAAQTQHGTGPLKMPGDQHHTSRRHHPDRRHHTGRRTKPAAQHYAGPRMLPAPQQPAGPPMIPAAQYYADPPMMPAPQYYADPPIMPAAQHYAGPPMIPAPQQSAGPPMMPAAQHYAGPPMIPAARQPAGPPMMPAARYYAGPPMMPAAQYHAPPQHSLALMNRMNERDGTTAQFPHSIRQGDQWILKFLTTETLVYNISN